MKASLLTTRATQPSSQTSESRQKDAYLQVNSLRRSLTWASSSTLNGLLCFQVMGSQWEKMIRLTIIGCTIMAWSFSKVRNYDKHSSTLNDCNFFWNEIQNCYIFFLLSSFLVTQSLSLFFFLSFLSTIFIFLRNVQIGDEVQNLKSGYVFVTDEASEVTLATVDFYFEELYRKENMRLRCFLFDVISFF